MKTAIAAVAVLALAMPAWAQDPNADWDLVVDERQKTVLAYTVFDVGLGISVRCTDGAYDAVIGGLPAAGERETRPLTLTFGDEPSGWSLDWNVAIDDTMAVSPLPAMMARRLRNGGRLQIRVPDGAGEGRALRYDLELPASAAAIDQTLTACDRPLVDPRDAELETLDDGGLPRGILWRERPRPDYPMGADTYARGFAVVSCLSSPDGSVRDCVIESEHPREAGFGEAVVRSLRRARLTTPDGEGEVPVARFFFRTHFIMQGYETAEDRERRRQSREAQRREREARDASGD